MQLGDKIDQNSYFKSIIDEAQEITGDLPYAQKRAFAMNSSGNDDFSLEDEVQMSFEEIVINANT